MKYWILFLISFNLFSADHESLQQTGRSENRFDLVFIGDRYFADEMDQYHSDVNCIWQGMTEHYAFWNRYKNFFNIHRIDLVSIENNASEIRDPSNSAFGIDFLNGNFKGRATSDWSRALDLSESIGVGNESTIILTNRYYNLGFAATNPRTGLIYAAPWISIVAHELGHIIGYVGDEYKVTLQEAHFNLFENFAKNEGQANERWGHWIGYSDNFLGYTIGSPYMEHDTNYFKPTSYDGLMNTSAGGDLHALNREKMILGMYEYVNPIDSYTENKKTISRNAVLELNVVDRNVISTAWVINGSIVSNEASIDLSKFNLNAGDIVYGCAWDNSLNTDFKTNDRGGWVRKDDRGLLSQIVSWKIGNYNYLYNISYTSDYIEGDNSHLLDLILSSSSETVFFDEDNVTTFSVGDESGDDSGSDSNTEGSGYWTHTDLFGLIYDSRNGGWIYHPKYQWMYVTPEWYWIESERDWMWTKVGIYPYFYSNNLKTWVLL